MKHFDRAYLIWALSWAAAGMALGIFMAASGNHGEFVAHAHILLVGFVTSLIYAVIHKLWLPAPAKVTGTVQFVLHQAGAIAMSAGLLMLYGGFASESRLAPLLGPSAIAIILGMLLMLVMVVRAGSSTQPHGVDAVEARRAAAN